MNLTDRYLRILGISSARPTLHTLKAIVEAHVTRIPFENVSKLYRWRREGLAGVPSLDEYLDGIERQRFGGTCYANNHHLFGLLASLEFDVSLCSADMSSPDVHMVVFATVEGRDYLVDAGYAAPFLAPLPRDLLSDQVIVSGRDRYVLKPRDAEGRSRMELHRDGAFKHAYLAKPAPRRLEDFEPVVAASYLPSATFMNSLLLARFWPGGSLVIHNMSIVRSDGTAFETRGIASREELARTVEQGFGIPAAIVSEVLAGLPGLRDAWG